MKRYTWNVIDWVGSELREQFPELSPLQLSLLATRGVDTQAAIDEFLAPDYESDLHDPFLFPDMQKAVDRVFAAIDAGEKIVVYGDYDVDGMTGTTVLLDVFDLIPNVHVEGFIPNRYKDGYGVSLGNVERFVKDGVSLMITVDCGISNAEQIDAGRALGLETIVTDHHHIPERIPNAVAIIHPLLEGTTYPYPWLTGVAVAYKFALAILSEARKRGVVDVPNGWEKWLLDLVALGTVADCGNLLGENRTLLMFGLKVLAKTRRLGLQQLMNVSDIDQDRVCGTDIGFGIGPRINAPSRVEDPMPSFRLLRAKNIDDAERYAWKLENYNIQRRALTDEIREEIEEMYGDTIEDQTLLFAVGDDWREGVLGLVAGRLMERYQIPVVLLIRKEGGEVTGSLRSPESFNIIENLTALSDLLERFGGHAQAAGLTVLEKNVTKFEKELRKRADATLGSDAISPTLDIAAELRHDDITWSLQGDIARLAPFGNGNEEPLFAVRRLKVAEWKPVGSTKEHLKLSLETKHGKLIPAIAFGLGECAERLSDGILVDVAAWIDVNEWNGSRELQLRVKDMDIVSS